jgi:maltokinase-like protein
VPSVAPPHWRVRYHLGMAILHEATLSPTKLELVKSWLPTRSWYQGSDDPTVTKVAGFRFDDPANEVGIETLIVNADGSLYQVPLTYRGAPLAGHEKWLVGTMHHSVLGERFAYDACGDPVYVAVVAAAMLGTAAQAEEYRSSEGKLERIEPSMFARGSGGPGQVPTAITHVDEGDPTLVVTDTVTVAVRRDLANTASEAEGQATLTGRWAGSGRVLLGYLDTLEP